MSTSTTIDATYVATNSCTVIALTGTPTITWSGTIDTGGPVAVNVNSGTVVFNGVLTLADSGSSVTVASGATVTHAAENKTGVQITAPTVTITGSVNTNGKGCGVNKGVNGTNDCAAGNPGAPGNNYGGAAHGGAAGTGYFTAANTATYGSSTYPTLLGSGGGAGSVGPGGGRVSFVVSGVLTVNGSVSANGSTGGGSGGSVYVKAATLNGTGTISANGGTAGGGCNGGTGEGGGGRIAIYYDAGTFGFTDATKITVNHGTGACGDSKNGTTFILNRQVDDGAGTLTFNGGGYFVAGGDYIRDTINITSGTYLSCDTALTTLTVSSTNALSFPLSSWSCAPTAGTALSIGSNSTVSFTSVTGTFGGTMGAVRIDGTAVTMSGVLWNVTGANSFTINSANFSNSASSTLAVIKAGSYTSLNTSGNLTLTNFNYLGGTAGTVSGETGGHFLLPRGVDVTLTNSSILANVSSTLSNLTIDSTSQIGANAKGCSGGTGPNASNVCTAATAGYGPSYGGAGHGAVGGTGYFSVGGASYGSSTYPILFGSGNTNGPGIGGGRVWFTVTGTLTNNGLITANGGTRGGSGGSIYLNASILAGTGNVSSTGAAGDGNNGCGAGGRIAIIGSLITFSGTSSTSGGTTGCTGPAGTGTIYRLQTNSPPNAPTSLGQGTLVDGSTTSTQTPTFSFSLTDPNVADTVKYQIQIDDTSDFSSPVVDYTSALAAQGTRAFQVGQAAGSGTYLVGSSGQTLASGNYYWRVKTIDNSASASSYATARSGSIAFVVDAASRTIQFAQTTESELESVTATSVRILLSTAHFETVTVQYALTGTATGGGVDYTLAAGTATISAGQTSTTIPISIGNDAFHETDETIILTLVSPTGSNVSLGSNTTFTYTVRDDDVAGITLTESSGSTSVTEAGATDDLSLVLTSRPESDVQIVFATSTSGVTLSTSSVTFTSSSWSTPQTVTVTATDDAIYQGTHTGTITPSVVSSALGYSEFSLSPITATVTDNDTASITLTESSGSTAVTEGGPTDSFDVVLTSAPTSTVTLNFATSTNGVTLSASSLSFTSANWSTPQTVTVTATDDAIYQGTHTGTITPSVVSSALGYSEFSLSPITATVTDNDSADISVSDFSTPRSVTEGGASDSYQIVLHSEPTSTVAVLIDSSDSAQVSVSTSSVVFTASNWNTPVTVTISAMNDDIVEPDQSFTITHSVTSLDAAYDGISVHDITGTIHDNDTAGVTITESDGSTDVTEGGAMDSFEVVLQSVPTSTVSIQFATTTQGVFLSTSTLTFSSLNWNVPQTVTVTAVDDALAQGTHVATSTPTILTTAFGYSGLSLDPITATITDNDVVSVEISDYSTPRSISESGTTDTYQIVLSSEPTSDVTVALTSSDEEQFSVSTSSVLFMPTNWNTPVTVTLSATDDQVAEPDVAFTVTHTVTSLDAAYDGLSAHEIAGTIHDNDTAGVTITESAGSTDVTEGGMTDSFEVVLTSAPTSTVSIELATSTAGVTLSTSTLVFTSANWNVPQTVGVTAVETPVAEGAHTGTITFALTTTAYGYTELSLTPITAHITDSSVVNVLVSAATTTRSVTEGSISDEYTLSLSSEPMSEVSIEINASTELVTVSTSTVVFTATNWNVPVTVRIEAPEDDIAYPEATSSIHHVATSLDTAYDHLTIPSISVHYLDNDTPGVTVHQSDDSTDVTEGGASDSFEVVLSSAPTSTVSINVATTTGAVLLSTTSLNFDASNWSVPQTVTVTAIDDAIAQGTHTDSLSLTVHSSGYGYADRAVTPITVHVTDNDTTSVDISEASRSRTLSESGTTDSYQIVLRSEPTAEVVVSLTPSDTEQFTVSTSSILFTPENWNTPVEVTLSAIDDLFAEPLQEIAVTHTVSSTDPTYNELTLPSLHGTIADNDTAGITLTGTEGLTVTEGGSSVTFTAVLQTRPTSTVELRFATSTDGLTVDPVVLSFDSENWNAPQTVHVSPLDDLLTQGTRTGVITQTLSTGAYGYSALAVDPILVTVRDNEEGAITVSTSTLLLAPGGEGSYTIVLNAVPTSTVQILLAADPFIAVSATTLTFDASNWDTPQTVHVLNIEDLAEVHERSLPISQTVSSTTVFASIRLPEVTVTVQGHTPAPETTPSSGGGGGGGGAGAIGGGSSGGGSVTTIFSLISNLPAPEVHAVPPTPLIIVAPLPGEPPAPAPVPLPQQEVVTILNPSDVRSLIEATHSGRDFTAEGKNLSAMQADAKEFRVPLQNGDVLRLTNFVTYGISARTRDLGEGERRSLVRDALETMQTSSISETDLERMARGIIPEFRNLKAERQQLSRVRATFKTIFGHDPNFKRSEENMAWNTLMYRMRFPRDLSAEKKGILAFKSTFKKSPQSPFQWATVRVLGYVK